MFKNNTVFILGAGASWHYGYPTGEGLVENIISMAERLASHSINRLNTGYFIQLLPKYVEQRIAPNQGLNGARATWQGVQEECQALITRLRSVRPLLIDHFLAWNESLRPIGKLMIAAAILECEAIWLQEGTNQNHRLKLKNAPIKPAADDLRRIDLTKYADDWYRFIVHKLVYGCSASADLTENKVHFITFNYDTSLEYQLYQALASIDLIGPTAAKDFLTKGRIVHVYGSVHRGIPTERGAIELDAVSKLGEHFGGHINFEHELGSRSQFLDHCLSAAENLRTIDPHDKEQDEDSLKCAREWLHEADVVYILGYGFDSNNNRRIGMDSALSLSKAAHRSVMFTNFGDVNTINKQASKLLFGRHDQFLGHFVHGAPIKGSYAEKSVRTVYDALAFDFDALESEFIARSKI